MNVYFRFNFVFWNIPSALFFIFSLLTTGCKDVASIGDDPAGNVKAYQPHDLTVEFIREPKHVLIQDSKPEFGWEVPKSARSQRAYQIFAASSKEFLNENNANLWDSGKVLTSQSFNVEYHGELLENGKTFYWKVKLWDDEGKQSAFSKIQGFKMASLSKEGITPNSFQIDSIKPVKFRTTNSHSYLIDFGKAAFATLQFQYKSKTNDTLVVRIGEQLTNDAINRDPQGSIRYQEVRVPVNPNDNNYILQIRPDERNTKIGAIALPDSFPVLMPFRYAEIENVKEAITDNEFTQLAYHGYWNDLESHFSSSDTILNQVWDLCKYSIKATTFTGLYVDGDRERIPYEADAYLNQLSHYTTDREYAMARRTIEYFMQHPTWPTEWQLHVALMFYADYMYTGNTELIERYYDDLKHKTLMELRRDDGLISSAKATPDFMKKLGFNDPKTRLKDIVDWPPAQKDTGWQLATKEGERDGFVFKPINTMVNCFYYRNIEIMAEFAEIVGNKEEAEVYKALAKQIRQSINMKLFNAEKGVYVDGEGTNHASLHANMMALAFNIVPDKHIKSVADFVKSRGMACSVYGAQYLLEALYNANESDYALELMTSTENRSWFNMIRIGSTITLEAWDMKYKPNSDWNHAWGAVPANMVSRGLWGIKPKVPGYEVASIKPQLGSLKETSIVVPTIKGQIKADYILQENKHNYTIEIPANMSAEFNSTSTDIIMHNGKKVEDGISFIKLTSGIHSIQMIKN